jgi:RNA polymerase sigma factor (sigma-70 family)
MGAVAAVTDLTAASCPSPVSAAVAVADDFEQLYRANYRKLVQLAYLLTQSSETAHDLVQDVFARVLPRWQGLDDPVPYLRRSVVNAANSWRRRLRLERLRPANVEESATLQADELFDVLAQLPIRQRSAVVLRFYEGLTDAEVATLLGCRPGTVASLVHRAFEQMRQAMADSPRPGHGQRPPADREGTPREAGTPEEAVREGDQT